MKKAIIGIWFGLLCLLVLCTGCKFVVEVTSVQIPESLVMGVGETVTIAATVYPSDATFDTVEWRSSDKAVVTVTGDGFRNSTGTLEAKYFGTTTVKVFANGIASNVCTVTVTGDGSSYIPDTPENPSSLSVSIDGRFDDWAGIPAGCYSAAVSSDNAVLPALTYCMVCADPGYIYVYIEWNTDLVEYLPDVDHVPFHCYINTDGDSSTGGYADVFSDACTDVLTEGFLYDSNGICSYDPGVYGWEGKANAYGWCWGDALLGDNSGFGQGAGIPGRYEFRLSRARLRDVGYPVADVFSIGFDIDRDWSAVGILPNTNPSSGNLRGMMPTLQVRTVK